MPPSTASLRGLPIRRRASPSPAFAGLRPSAPGARRPNCIAAKPWRWRAGAACRSISREADPASTGTAWRSTPIPKPTLSCTRSRISCSLRPSEGACRISGWARDRIRPSARRPNGRPPCRCWNERWTRPPPRCLVFCGRRLSASRRWPRSSIRTGSKGWNARPRRISRRCSREVTECGLAELAGRRTEDRQSSMREMR